MESADGKRRQGQPLDVVLDTGVCIVGIYKPGEGYCFGVKWLRLTAASVRREPQFVQRNLRCATGTWALR